MGSTTLCHRGPGINATEEVHPYAKNSRIGASQSEAD